MPPNYCGHLGKYTNDPAVRAHPTFWVMKSASVASRIFGHLRERNTRKGGCRSFTGGFDSIR